MPTPLTRLVPIKGIRTQIKESYRNGSYQIQEGSRSEIEVLAYLFRGHDDKLWLQLEGGPTGYESMPWDRLPNAIETGAGWCACAGGNGWDKLHIPVEELNRLPLEFDSGDFGS